MKWTPRHVLVLLLILVASLGVLGAAVVYQYWYVLDKQVVEAKVEIMEGQTIGLAVGKELLDFGKVPQDGRGVRRATMESKVPATAIISINGMDELLSVSQNRITLEPNTPVQVEFVVTAANTTAPGNYSAIVTIKYVRTTLRK
jgi:hypothetical protein